MPMHTSPCSGASAEDWKNAMHTDNAQKRGKPFPLRNMRLLDPRDDLPANRAVLVGGVDEVEEVGRDGQCQLVIGQRGAGDFLRRERGHQALELLYGGDAVLELPLPVGPV